MKSSSFCQSGLRDSVWERIKGKTETMVPKTQTPKYNVAQPKKEFVFPVVRQL